LTQSAAQVIGRQVIGRFVQLQDVVGQHRVGLVRPRQAVPQHLRRPELQEFRFAVAAFAHDLPARLPR
jgi:hypothetical protein